MEQRLVLQAGINARSPDRGGKTVHKKNTAATSSASNADMKSAAQLRVVINQYGMLELDLSDRQLRRVPDTVFTLTRLEVLRLGRNRLRTIPASISALRRLRHLDVGNNDLDELPTTLGACGHMIELDARGNRLSSIPGTLPSGLARHLRSLKLAGNRIEALPMDFGRLVSLRRVDLSSNRMRELPSSTGELHDLVALNLSDNGFEELPVSLCRLVNLEVLDLSRNQLSSLPEDFSRLRRLRELRLASNRFDSVPASVCRVASLAVLDVSDNTLTSLPVGLAALQRLAELDVRRNAIDRFPEVASGWMCLERLNVTGNRLRVLPVGTMTRLHRLDADQNWLTEVPQGLHRLASTLESLSLAGNRITHLSADVALLKRLRVLDVSRNALQSVPGAIEQMPGLETLDVTGNSLMHRQNGDRRPVNGRQHRDEPTMPYVFDGLSGPPPQVGVPLVFTQTPYGLLYAAPANPTPPHLNPSMGHPGAASSRFVAGGPTGTAPPAPTSSPPQSGRKSSGGGVMRFFRPRNKHSIGRGGNSSTDGDSSGDKKVTGLNAGTQTASNGVAVGLFPPFTSSRSEMLSPTSMSVMTGSGARSDLDQRPVRNRRIGNGLQSNKTNGGGERAVNSSGRSLSTDNLRDSGFTAPGERRVPPAPGQPWRSATDIALLANEEARQGNHRSGDPDDDDDDGGEEGISDTVTVNEEIGDELSLGEDDFEFMPENFHDAKLLRIAGSLETMLTKQLLDPITDGTQDGGRQNRTKMTEEPRARRDAEKKNENRTETFNSVWKVLSETDVDSSKLRHTANGHDDVFTSKEKQNAARSGGPLRRLVPPPPEVVPDTSAAAALNVGVADTFQVGRDGGLFRSSTNPDVSIYIPSEALGEAITIRMQVISIAAELLNEPTVVSIGDIVTLRDVTDDVTERRFRHHVTVTVPTPRAVVDMGGLGTAGKLNVLTYRGAAGLNMSPRTLPSTCQPCAYDYATTRKGIVSIRAWHLIGLGTVLTKSGNSFAACQSIDNILRRLNSYQTLLVTSAAV